MESVDGLVDEVLFTETGRNGVSLIVYSWMGAEGPPEDGSLPWTAKHLDGATAWLSAVPTAGHLSRGRRGAVSGTRDRVLRNRRDGRVLSVRRPDEPRAFFRYEDGQLVPDVEESEEEGEEAPAEGEPAEDEASE